MRPGFVRISASGCQRGPAKQPKSVRESIKLDGCDRLFGQHHRNIILDSVNQFASLGDQGCVQCLLHRLPIDVGQGSLGDRLIERPQALLAELADRDLGCRATQDIEKSRVNTHGVCKFLVKMGPE